MAASWRVLRTGSGDDAVALIGYPVRGVEATFDDLCANLDADATLLAAVFPPPASMSRASLAQATDPARWCHHWLADVRARRLVVRGVVGHCAGAALAHRLAGAVAATGSPPPAIVLVDPEYVGAGTLRQLYGARLDTLREQLDPAELAAALRAGDQALAAVRTGAGAVAAPDLAERTVRLAAALWHSYRRYAVLAAGRLGIDEALVDQLHEYFSSFLAYQGTAWRAAAHRGDPPPGRAGTVIESAEHAAARGTRPDHRLDTPRTRLLADRRAAGAIARHLFTAHPTAA